MSVWSPASLCHDGQDHGWEIQRQARRHPESERHEHVYRDLDHDIIDGAPAARFVTRLKELIESGFGLVDQEVMADV